MERLFCDIICFILIFCFTCSAFADENVVNDIEKNNDPKATKLLRCLIIYGDETEKCFRFLDK